MRPVSWERVWEEVKPKLGAIHNSQNSEEQVESRVIRVGQLDAELLDQQLVQLLQDPLSKALSLVNVRSGSC